MISSCLSWSHSSRLGERGGGGGDGDRDLPRRSVSLQYEMARATDSALSRAVSSTAAMDDGNPFPSLLAFLSLIEILRRYLCRVAWRSNMLALTNYKVTSPIETPIVAKPNA